MITADIFYRFGVALIIGVLIGIQREFAHGVFSRELLAGTRTFGLIALFGCTAAFIADQQGEAGIFLGLILMLGVLIIISHFIAAWKRDEIGLTTEVAALLTALIGALCYWNYIILAVALAVTTTVILAIKLEAQVFVQRISREDIIATLRFAVITAIILPILPNQNYGIPPLDVFNPYNIWKMVVLISGISFLGYILIKTLGSRWGLSLSGFLGGLVSSTAVTLSFAERSRKQDKLAKPFALAIIVSWTLMFVRVLAVVAVLNFDLFEILWPPIAAGSIIGLGYCLYLFRAQGTAKDSDIAFSNPFELSSAIFFGLLYAIVLFISKAASVYFGDTGVYVSSLVAGLADVDAITISMAEFSGLQGTLALSVAERAIVIATMSNTVVKGGIVLFSGSKSLRRALWPAIPLIMIAALGVAFLL